MFSPHVGGVWHDHLMFVVTIDQRRSRSSADRVRHSSTRWAAMPVTAAFERTAGDEVQGLLGDPAAVRATCSSRCATADAHCGVGVGDVDEQGPCPPEPGRSRGRLYRRPLRRRRRQGSPRLRGDTGRGRPRVAGRAHVGDGLGSRLRSGVGPGRAARARPHGAQWRVVDAVDRSRRCLRRSWASRPPRSPGPTTVPDPGGTRGYPALDGCSPARTRAALADRSGEHPAAAARAGPGAQTASAGSPGDEHLARLDPHRDRRDGQPPRLRRAGVADRVTRPALRAGASLRRSRSPATSASRCGADATTPTPQVREVLRGGMWIGILERLELDRRDPRRSPRARRRGGSRKALGATREIARTRRC